MLGVNDDGLALGTSDGSVDGIKLGEHGTPDGVLDGSRLGTMLGVNDDGLALGTSDGSVDGIKLGTPDGDFFKLPLHFIEQ
jgi:hypothetical protein